MNKILFVTIIPAMLWLSACAVQNTPTLVPQPLPTVVPVNPTSTVASRPSTPPNPVEIGDDDKGKTFAASVGQRIRIVLHSTYWQFDDLQSNQTLKQLDAPAVTPDMTVGIPGTGAGTIVAEFQAVGPGQVSIKATRDSCGEALRCAEDQRVFQVAVVVK